MTDFRKLPPLNELTAFDAIARHRSFTKAAQELFLTPSAISQRLRQLEERLGIQLVVRTRTSVQVTGDGARYVEIVREALSRLAAASDTFSAAAATKRLRLGVMPALASNWLINRLRVFRKQHPDIEVDIQSATAMAKVEAGEVDIGLRWGKGGWAGLEQIKLFPDELVAVCSKPYLKEVRPQRSPADLQRAVLLRNAMQPWKPWFDKAGLEWAEPATGPSFNDSTLALQAAVEGHGVALGRRLLVQQLLEAGSLVQLFDVTATIEEAFYAVFAKRSLARPEVAAFLEWIKQIAEHEQLASTGHASATARRRSSRARTRDA
jgi:LysR family glycine cleavage system transcriptional activator